MSRACPIIAGSVCNSKHIDMHRWRLSVDDHILWWVTDSTMLRINDRRPQMVWHGSLAPQPFQDFRRRFLQRLGMLGTHWCTHVAQQRSGLPLGVSMARDDHHEPKCSRVLKNQCQGHPPMTSGQGHPPMLAVDSRTAQYFCSFKAQMSWRVLALSPLFPTPASKTNPKTFWPCLTVCYINSS
jgi:hypothetical protein